MPYAAPLFKPPPLFHHVRFFVFLCDVPSCVDCMCSVLRLACVSPEREAPGSCVVPELWMERGTLPFVRLLVHLMEGACCQGLPGAHWRSRNCLLAQHVSSDPRPCWFPLARRGEACRGARDSGQEGMRSEAAGPSGPSRTTVP